MRVIASVTIGIVTVAVAIALLGRADGEAVGAVGDGAGQAAEETAPEAGLASPECAGATGPAADLGRVADLHLTAPSAATQEQLRTVAADASAAVARCHRALVDAGSEGGGVSDAGRRLEEFTHLTSRLQRAAGELAGALLHEQAEAADLADRYETIRAEWNLVLERAPGTGGASLEGPVPTERETDPSEPAPRGGGGG
jgi:hypothetical protein